MGMMHFAFKWAKRLITLGLFTFAAVCLWTLLWPTTDGANTRPADVIICLGSGYDIDGRVDKAGQKRAKKCTDLYLKGVAPRIIFTGGSVDPTLQPFGDAMMAYAISLGIDPAHVSSETLSQSTLHNALFSMPLIAQGDRIVLVSEAFHLPRSWASFKWSGADEIILVASERLRRDPLTDQPHYLMLVREVAAIWFNLARATIWSAASIFGKENNSWLH